MFTRSRRIMAQRYWYQLKKIRIFSHKHANWKGFALRSESSLNNSELAIAESMFFFEVISILIIECEQLQVSSKNQCMLLFHNFFSLISLLSSNHFSCVRYVNKIIKGWTYRSAESYLFEIFHFLIVMYSVHAIRSKKLIWFKCTALMATFNYMITVLHVI